MDIKARAFKTGWENSDITSSIYTLSVVTPTFNPAGGEYSSSQYITLSCVTSGAEIRYTTNSIDPVISSLLYESPLNITSSMLIKAKGFKTGWVDS
jgi:chitinase